MPSNQTLKDETSMCSEARSKTSVQTCSALPTMLLDPGVDDGLDQIPAERGDEALARLVGHDETMLFQDRQVPVSGAHAYLQPISHRRGTNLTALQDRDEYLLLPLGDVHPRHTVRVSSLRGRRRSLPLFELSLSGGDGGHGTATDVVLGGDRIADLLGRCTGDAKPGSDAPDLTKGLRRGTAETELHCPAFVLHPRSLVRDAYDVALVENGDNYPLVASVYQVLHHLPNRLLGNSAPSLFHLLRHEPGELPRGGTRVGRRNLGYLRRVTIRIDCYADAHARLLCLPWCPLCVHHPH